MHDALWGIDPAGVTPRAETFMHRPGDALDADLTIEMVREGTGHDDEYAVVHSAVVEPGALNPVHADLLREVLQLGVAAFPPLDPGGLAEGAVRDGLDSLVGNTTTV